MNCASLANSSQAPGPPPFAPARADCRTGQITLLRRPRRPDDFVLIASSDADAKGRLLEGVKRWNTLTKSRAVGDDASPGGHGVLSAPAVPPMRCGRTLVGIQVVHHASPRSGSDSAPRRRVRRPQSSIAESRGAWQRVDNARRDKCPMLGSKARTGGPLSSVASRRPCFSAALEVIDLEKVLGKRSAAHCRVDLHRAVDGYIHGVGGIIQRAGSGLLPRGEGRQRSLWPHTWCRTSPRRMNPCGRPARLARAHHVGRDLRALARKRGGGG